MIGVANFKIVRQWKAPKCDRGHEFERGTFGLANWKAPKCDRGLELRLPAKVGWEEESINRE